MRERLPKETFKALKRTLTTGEPLTEGVAQVVAAANAAAPANATLLPDVRNALDAVRDLPGDDKAPVIISGSLYMLAEFYSLYPHLLEQPASARGAKEDA